MTNAAFRTVPAAAVMRRHAAPLDAARSGTAPPDAARPDAAPRDAARPYAPPPVTARPGTARSYAPSADAPPADTARPGTAPPYAAPADTTSADTTSAETTPAETTPAGAVQPSHRARTPRLIAIASGKGGVGKTWFAITLAHALARQGRKVLLFDADLGLANVDVQLGLTPTLDLGDVIAGRATVAQAALCHPEGGFHVLAGRSGSGMLSGLAAATLDHTLAALRSAATGFDPVLLDLGAGVEPPVRRLAAFSDTLLVLLTEEPTSLTDAYAVLKLHTADRPGGDARVIVNQAASQAAAEHTYATLRRACATFLGREPSLAGVIRRDDRVREAIRRQALLLTRHPNCAAATDVTQLAATLLT